MQGDSVKQRRLLLEYWGPMGITQEGGEADVCALCPGPLRLKTMRLGSTTQKERRNNCSPESDPLRGIRCS